MPMNSPLPCSGSAGAGHLVHRDRLSRTEVDGQFLYTAIEMPQRRNQVMARRSAQAVPLAVDASGLQVSPDELKAAILLFYGLLDEQQRRLFAGLESIRLGHGGDTLLGDFLGLEAHTVARGRQQLLDRNVVSGRTRRHGTCLKASIPNRGQPDRSG